MYPGLAFLVSLMGCAHVPVSPTRALSSTELGPATHPPTRDTYTSSSQPMGDLHLRYRGDTDHRIVQLTIVTPGVQRVDGRSDLSMWPTVYVRYSVPSGTSTVLLQGMSYSPHRTGLMACRSNFTLMSARYAGYPINVTERVTGGNCFIEIVLPRP